MYTAKAVRERSKKKLPTEYLYYSCQLYRSRVRVTAHVNKHFSLPSETIKMALGGSQQRKMVWYMFGMPFILVGICNNHLARTVSIRYRCTCSTRSITDLFLHERRRNLNKRLLDNTRVLLFVGNVDMFCYLTHNVLPLCMHMPYSFCLLCYHQGKIILN